MTAHTLSLRRRCSVCGAYVPADIACARCQRRGVSGGASEPAGGASPDDPIALASRAVFADWSSDRPVSTDVRIRAFCDEDVADVEAAEPRAAEPAMPELGRTRAVYADATTEVRLDELFSQPVDDGRWRGAIAGLLVAATAGMLLALAL